MIAITGANGLLGSFIVRKLIAAGESFIAIRRKDSDTSLLADVAGRVEWRTADIADPVAIEEALQGVTHVIHAAAMVSFNPSLKKRIYDMNVLGTRNIVNACLANNIKRLVHISSVAALGRQKGQTEITEDNKWIESSVNSTYAESKYYAEVEVFRAQEEGLSTVIVNPSVILAPADWRKSSAQLFKYAWDEKRFYINSNLNYVDVRDVSEAVYMLLHDSVQGQRFIVSAGSIPFLDFFRSVSRNFNKRPPSVRLDTGALHLVARLETLRSRIMNREPLLTVETARLAGTHFNYSNQKIKKTLKFEFQTIDATLAWCCAYYLNFIAKK
jgi:dihydroflavonol-4-reductase